MSTNKPIALICENASSGIQYLLNKFKVVEYNSRRAVTDTKQEYILITTLDQLKAWEFKDYDVAPGAGKNPEYNQIRDWIGTRIR